MDKVDSSRSGNIRTTDGRARLFDSILDTVGDTPAIRINNLGVDHATLYVKAEFFNPAASVKDRLALNIIEDAERRGLLKPGQTVVEATSGNTGVGLALVCAQKGYPLVVTMAESFSVERRRLMRMLGAKVVLTPRELKGFGMYQKAKELADRNGWYLARQLGGQTCIQVFFFRIQPEDQLSLVNAVPFFLEKFGYNTGHLGRKLYKTVGRFHLGNGSHHTHIVQAV